MSIASDWTEYALIAEPDVGESMATLCATRSFCELPWGDGLLIESQLRHAAEAGAKRVDVLVRRASETLRERLQEGRPWGMVVRILEDSRPWRFVEDHRLLRSLFPGVTSALAGSLLPADVERWFRQSRPATWACNTRYRAVATRVDLAAGIAATTGLIHRETVQTLETPQHLLDANLALLRAANGNIVLLQEVSEGLHLSREASVPSWDRFSGVNLVDSGAFIDTNVAGLKDCLVGKGATIGPGVRLDRCLLMPGSAIGANLHLEDMIVDGPVIFDLASNTPVMIDDIDLLPVTSPRESAVPMSDRLLALALLVAGALPAAVCWLLARLSGKVGLVTERRFVPSGRSLTGRQLWMAIDLSSLAWGARLGLHRLFWLTAVVRGVIRLRGDVIPPDCEDLTSLRPDLRFGVYPSARDRALVGSPMRQAEEIR